MRAVLMPFGLSFAEPVDVTFPTREVAEAMLCGQRQIAVFDGRPLCELMATDMVESRPTERDATGVRACTATPATAANTHPESGPCSAR